MRLSILLFFGILFSGNSIAQIDSVDFFLFSIAKISPEYANERVYNDSNDNYIFVKKERFYSIISQDSLDLEKLNSEILLKVSDWNKIKKILKPSEKELNKLKNLEVADCYIPRHAMIFYNGLDEVVGLIEICFECQQSKTYGECSYWGINITPKGYEKLEKIYARKKSRNKKNGR
jgi:hypothetical protein